MTIRKHEKLVKNYRDGSYCFYIDSERLFRLKNCYGEDPGLYQLTIHSDLVVFNKFQIIKCRYDLFDMLDCYVANKGHLYE